MQYHKAVRETKTLNSITTNNHQQNIAQRIYTAKRDWKALSLRRSRLEFHKTTRE